MEEGKSVLPGIIKRMGGYAAKEVFEKTRTGFLWRKPPF